MSDITRRLARLGVATVYEANDHRGWISGLQRLSTRAVIAGTVRTATCSPFDNVGLLQGLAQAKSGEVLVAVSSEPSVMHTFMGDVIGTEAVEIGLAGMIIDGYIRDVDALNDLQFPVWARGVAPYSPKKDGPYIINEPVFVSGVAIEPGDYVVMDGDGAAIVKPSDVDSVLEQGEIRHGREESMRSRIRNGERIVDIGQLRNK